MLHTGAERTMLAYAAAAVALAGVLRYLDYLMQDRSWFLFADTMIYIAIIVGWMYSMTERIIDPKIRRYQRGIADCMILFLLLRACRNDYFAELPILGRLCWYAYYIPSALVPLYMARTAFHCAGEPDTLRKPLKAASAGILILILVCLTNDLHGLVFLIRDSNPAGKMYGYGPLFVPCLVLPFVILVTTLFLMYRSKERRSREDLLFPAVVLTAAILVTLGIPGRQLPDLEFRPYEAPSLLVLACLAFSESCIAHGLIPSNDGRDAYFRKQGTPAVLMDADGTVRYRTDNAGDFTEEEMDAARTAPVQLPDGRLLKCARVRGGFAYWKEDLSEVRRLSGELKEAGERLAEEQALISAENSQLETRLRTEAQNELYDRMQEEIRQTLGPLSSIIGTTDPESGDFDLRMMRACFLGASVKRRCNLILLSDESGHIRAEEIDLSVRELLSYLELSGITAGLTSKVDGLLCTETAMLAYDFTEYILERGGQGMSAAMVSAEEDGEDVIVRIVTETPAQIPDPEWERERLSAAGGSFTFRFEDGTCFSRLRVRRGLI